MIEIIFSGYLFSSKMVYTRHFYYHLGENTDRKWCPYNIQPKCDRFWHVPVHSREQTWSRLFQC